MQDDDAKSGADSRPRKRAGARLSRTDLVGRQLRAAYEEVLSEPVPDRFMDLLAALDAKKGGQQ